MGGNSGRFHLLCCALVLAATGMLAHAERPERQCLDCHEADDAPIHAIAGTVHGSLAGGGSESCVACHGASVAHKQKATKNPPDVSFGPEHPSDPEVRSASCLGCHNTGDQLLWAGSEHHKENLSCDSCHNAHEREDMIQGKLSSQEICLDCHTEVKSQLQLPSRHPIAEGKTDCTDCHNPHGSAGEALLRQVTLNDNCFSCHADKRGPFLWEHPPVAEDCALCHKPHGSVHEPLLTARGPALCQQCHATAFHPGQPYGSEGLPGGTATANQNLVGKNCLNCHSQIHGSNHPSGARLTR
jgi:DmsE family decaheme c-type cytochrome